MRYPRFLKLSGLCLILLSFYGCVITDAIRNARGQNDTKGDPTQVNPTPPAVNPQPSGPKLSPLGPNAHHSSVALQGSVSPSIASTNFKISRVGVGFNVRSAQTNSGFKIQSAKEGL